MSRCIFVEYYTSYLALRSISKDKWEFSADLSGQKYVGLRSKARGRHVRLGRVETAVIRARPYVFTRRIVIECRKRDAGWVLTVIWAVVSSAVL